MNCVCFRRCLILALLSFQYGEATEKFEGDACVDILGTAGVCTPISICPQVHESLAKFEERPLLCSFNRSIPVVCCTPVVTADRIQIDNTENKNASVGDLADKYCRKYSEYTYTWVPSHIIDRAGSFINTCRQRPESIVDEPYPEPRSREFPHMIAFGVGPMSDINWVCSGALISDEFVMTTAKCATQLGGQPSVQWAIAGDFNLYDQDDDALTELVAVNQIFVHPQYGAARNKNDIALVKLQKKLILNRYVIPACLPVGKFSTAKAIVTSWHMTKNEGDLTRVTVVTVPESECRNITTRKMRNRPRNSKETKICAKPRFASDYCQRNSGDPLQFYRPGIHCMYDVIGLTTEFGDPCDSHTTYTDVSSYISWIEQRVWGQYIGQDMPENGPNRRPQTTTEYSTPGTIQTSTESSRPEAMPRPSSTPSSRPSSMQTSTHITTHHMNTQSGANNFFQNSTQTNQEAALEAALAGRQQLANGQWPSRNVTYINNRINGQNITGQNVIPINERNGQNPGQRNNTIYGRLTFN